MAIAPEGRGRKPPTILAESGLYCHSRTL